MNPATWLALGSGAVKLIGKLFGGKTEKVADKVAIIADVARSQVDPERYMTEKLADLPADDLIELKRLEVEVLEIKAGTRKVEIAADVSRHAENQASYRTEVQSSDIYVRHTRPGNARKSFWCGTIYLLGTELIKAILASQSIEYGGANLNIATMLYSPLAVYTGGRTLEAFSASGKTAGGLGIKDIVKAGVGLLKK